MDSCDLLAVAEHPGEPRYEVRDGCIRALYGHSIEVVIGVAFNVGAPPTLHHGSCWQALNSIVRYGLLPMQRQMVHLTNTSDEAMAVGRRKGDPLVFQISQNQTEEPVADGIWVAPLIQSHRLSIVNPFTDEAGVVR